MVNTDPPASSEVGKRVRAFRQARGLSMRGLAKEAGVTVSYVCGVEAGRVSPTIATLRKLLVAMGTDLGGFFTEDTWKMEKFVFRRESMRGVCDEKRRYAFMLPRRNDIRVEVVDEVIMPGDQPEFEILTSDLAGFVVEGELALEVENEEPQRLMPGDAFYIPPGRPVRGSSAQTDGDVHIVTIYAPPRY